MNNFETIKNISVFLFSVIVFTGLAIFYIKILSNFKKINIINKEIEEKQAEIDQDEIDGIKDIYEMVLADREQERNRKRMEQDIRKLMREKNNLLEEISIYKLFKK